MNKVYIIALSLLMSAQSYSMNKKTHPEEIPLTVFKDKGIINGDDQNITHTFLHYPEMFQRTYANLPCSVSRKIAQLVLGKIPLTSWALKTYELLREKKSWSRPYDSPTIPAYVEPSPLPDDPIAMACYNMAGERIAFKTRAGNVEVYDITDKIKTDPEIRVDGNLALVQFDNEDTIRTINQNGTARICDLESKNIFHGVQSEEIDVDCNSLVAFHARKLKKQAELIKLMNDNVPEDEALSYFHGFKRKLNNHKILDCQLDKKKQLVYLIAQNKSQVHEERELLEFPLKEEQANQEQNFIFAIYDINTEKLLHWQPNYKLQKGLFLHKKTNTLFTRELSKNTFRFVVYKLNELIELREYFQQGICLEQALLLSIIFQAQRHGVLLDFNEFPHLHVHFKNLPNGVQRTLEKFVINPVAKNCSIM